MKPWWAETAQMPRPVCVLCNRFFKTASTGRYVLEQVPGGPNAWVPYKLWSADVLRCSGCGKQIVTGFGREPIAEHFDPDFQNTLARIKASSEVIIVNDC
jgi:hypothetical protein